MLKLHITIGPNLCYLAIKIRRLSFGGHPVCRRFVFFFARPSLTIVQKEFSKGVLKRSSQKDFLERFPCLPLDELYSPMKRLVRYRTVTAEVANGRRIETEVRFLQITELLIKLLLNCSNRFGLPICQSRGDLPSRGHFALKAVSRGL